MHVLGLVIGRLIARLQHLPCGDSLLAEEIDIGILAAAVRAQHMNAAVKPLLEEDEKRLKLLGSCSLCARKEDVTTLFAIVIENN